VVEKFGRKEWVEALGKSRMDSGPKILPISDVDDESVLNIINSLCEILNISLTQLTDMFGEYWVNVYSQRMYSAYYKGAKTAKDFILKMDSVHVAMTKGTPGAQPPRFEYEWKDDKTLIMKYISHRNLIDLMVGLIKGVGRFYKSDLKVTKLGSDEVEIIFL
jgi:hypothetical protein